MDLLMLNKGPEFDAYTAPYRMHVKPFIRSFAQGGLLSPYLRVITKQYLSYLQWPNRMLEYSYIIKRASDIQMAKARVMDAGCGLSPLIRVFAQMGAEAWGVDASMEVVNFLNDPSSPLHDPLVRYSCQNITKLEIDDETFNLVTCVSVLEHLEPGDDTKAIGEMLRVLRKGGKLIITVDFVPRIRRTHMRPRTYVKGLMHRFAKAGYLLMTGKFSVLLKKSTLIGFNPFTIKFILDRGPYDFSSLDKYILKAFRDYIEGDISEPDVRTEDIKGFWSSHWYPSCGYEKNGDHWASVGLVFRKQ